MTFTVDQIEAEARELELSGKWPFASKCMLDYAAMKRREAETCWTCGNQKHEGSCVDPKWATAAMCDKLLAQSSPPSHPSTGVPDGWQLVPIEPTYEMLSQITLIEGFTHPAMTARYKAMLAAAPRSP